jgi:hypothetical protein
MEWRMVRMERRRRWGLMRRMLRLGSRFQSRTGGWTAMWTAYV